MSGQRYERTKYPGIYRGCDDGTYMIVVDVGVPGGKRREARQRGYRSIKAARAARDELHGQAPKGEYVEPSKITLADYLTDLWLLAMEGRIRPSTYDLYRRIIAVHIAPHPIGRTKLQSLTAPQLSGGRPTPGLWRRR